MAEKPTYDELEHKVVSLEQRIQSLEKEALMRKKAEDELKKRLSLEKMVAEISTQGVMVEDTSSFLDSCLEVMGRYLDVSRIYVLKYQGETDTYNIISEWDGAGVVSIKKKFQRF